MAPSLTLLPRASGGGNPNEHLTVKNGGTAAAIGLIVLIIGVTAIAAIGDYYLKKHMRTKRENKETAAANANAAMMSGANGDGFVNVDLESGSSSSGGKSSKASSWRSWYGLEKSSSQPRETAEGIEMV